MQSDRWSSTQGITLFSIAQDEKMVSVAKLGEDDANGNGVNGNGGNGGGASGDDSDDA